MKPLTGVRDMRKRMLIFGTAILAVGILFGAPPAVRAGSDDDLRGWIWNDNIGWISMNCVSDGTCAVVNYGVDLTSGNDLVGYGWSENVGWMCFGATCGGITPEGVPAYATVDPVTHDAHGWANIITLGADGWVALNCDDLSPGCADYAVNINRETGIVAGWAWNGNVGGGGGLGWFDFSWASVIAAETVCDDGFDNDSDGLIDCADPDCLGLPGPGGGVCGDESGPVNCTDGADNDGDTLVDCADPTSCWHVPASGCPDTETSCVDSVDNDFDDGLGGYDALPLTGIDCLDTDCAGDPACPATEMVCDDSVDDDLDGQLDCADDDCDPQCTGVCETDATITCISDPQCPPDIGGVQNCIETIFPWIKTFFQDIYSSGEIRALHPPPVGQVNATYCLLSAAGGVVNFRSDPAGGCEVPPSPASEVKLPVGATQYANVLGRLDIPGILAGTYGPVVPINNFDEIPEVLGGKVYYYNKPGEKLGNAAPVQFRNGVGGVSGAGIIVVRGSVEIGADITYEAAGVSNFRNLASVGWIILDDGSGTVGRLDIADPVEQVAGVFYVERRVGTGAGINPLHVSGAMISREFDFGRTAADPLIGSEEVEYDGRASINPPPGLADIAKGLPEIRSTAP